MTDNDIQLIRTLAQTVLGVILGLGAVSQAIEQTGLDPEYARGAAVAVSVVLVVAVGQRLPNNRAGRIASTALNGINRPPAYTGTPPADG